MKKSYLLLFFLLASGYIYAQDFDLMRKNFREKLTLGVDYDVTDATVKAKINGIVTNANTYWNTMAKTPATYLWSDYNYLKNNDSNTPSHVYWSYLRLLTMAQAYAYESSALYHNAQLLADIITGLNFMYAYAYNESTPMIGNFWEWRMGSPDAYARIISILYDDLPQTVKDNYTKAIVAFVRNFTITGNYTFGNQATVCKSLFYCGVLSSNMQDIQYALDNLIRAFVDETTVAQRKSAQTAFENLWKAQGDYHNYPVGRKEGFYEDGTFIQHIAIPYIGGYGAEIINASANMAMVLEGTGIGLSDNIKNSLFEWIDKAYFPTIYEGEMMMMYMGRNVTRNTHETARSIILDIAESAKLVPDVQNEVRAVCKRMFTHNTYYPDVYSGCDPILDKGRIDELINDPALSTDAENTPFNIVMAAGDRVIHNRPDFRFGISMSSSRIGKYEANPTQNARGWYIGDGMTYIYNSDRSQYVGYFTYVNARRLPGTTVDVVTRTSSTGNYGLFGVPPYAKDWVGGVSLRKLYGTAGMYLVGEVSSLEAKKSWFMFDDEIVALGAGIKLTEARKVETTIENRKGTNALYVDNVAKSQSRGWAETLVNPSWIHLQGASAYYFPEPATVNANRDTNGYTQLYIDHGTNPSDATYCYVLLPALSKEEVDAYASDPDIQIICNTDKVQAVWEKKLNVVGINFWEAGAADIVKSETAASVMFQKSNDTLYLSVADPSWKLATQKLILSGSYRLASSPTARIIVSASGEDNTELLINSSDKMGMAQEIVLINTNYSGIPSVSLNEPVFYPGGTSSEFIIDHLPAGETRIKVFSMMGNQLLSNSVLSSRAVMNLSAYYKGVYMVVCETSAGDRYVWKWNCF